MPEKTSQQISFGAGLNAQSAPHLLADGEVALATNVDFSLEWGALVCRRGTVGLGSVGVPTSIEFVGRNYNGTQGSSLDTSPWYAIGSGSDGFYRGTGTITFTNISAGDATAGGPAVGATYQAYTYLANGSKAIRDNGTNAYTWVLPQPPQPFVQMGTSGIIYPFSIGSGTGAFTGTWTASLGSVTAVGGSPVLCTLTNGTGGTATSSGIVAIATVVGSIVEISGGATNTLQNTNFDQSYPVQVPNANGIVYGTGTGTITQSIGVYGVDYLQIGFSNPNAVVAISVDYSIFDPFFFNYWHAQTTIGMIQSATPDPTAQLLSQQGNQSFADYTQLLANFNAGRLNANRGKVNGSGGGNVINLIQNLPNGVMTWAIPRTSYQLIGTYGFGSGVTGWANIGAVRVSIQTTDQTAMVIGIPKTYGNSLLCLQDTSNGINWFQTFAQVGTIGGVEVVLAESAPSLPSEATGTATDTNGVIVQYGAATLSVGTDSGTATDGVTHRIIYRQGGLLPDAYRVDMVPLSNGTLFTDGYYPDAQVISNSTMTRSLWSSWPSKGIGAVSEPFQDRLFIGTGNTLFWSTPGNPSQIESDSDVTVSVQGDPIQALIVWDRLVVVNNNSVYEINGSVWEGPNQDWTLRKTGSKRGSAASKTCIRTPDGIVLFGYDGISLYYPGYGIDTPLDWVYEKIGDFWRGTSSNSPAIQKGRIPALNFSAISQSCATYADHKIYLATPTGTNTAGCDTLWVLDMDRKSIWMHQPVGYQITSLYWDYAGGRLCVGASDGAVLQFEVGQTDLGSPIPWTVRTKAWSTKQDMIVENLGIEALATNSIISATAIVDNTNTYALGTFSNPHKQWYTTPLLGTVGNNLSLAFSGTQVGSANNQVIYQASWDALVLPQRVQYYRTDFETGASKEEKIWDVHYSEIAIWGTGTVTAVTFVDNVAVLTSTFIGPTQANEAPFPWPYGSSVGTLPGNGPQLIPQSFPTEIYGNVAYTTYTVGTFSNVTFQLYNDYCITRPEPPRMSSFVSDRYNLKTLSYWKPDLEAWWHDLRMEMNCLGSNVLATAHIDSQIIGTFVLTGSGRLGYHFSYPSETYGNEAYIEYHSVGGVFKHYQTWYEHTEEPTRSMFFESPLIALPTETYVKTWLADINPLGGTVVGTMMIDGIQVSTQTMTGTLRRVYEFGLPNVTTGKMVHCLYNSGSNFKYWEKGEGGYEFEPKPFAKQTWLVTYKKLGGITQLDMARFYAMDIEGPLNALITNTWIIDGVAFSTDTFTLSLANAGESTNTGRMYNDQIPFPSGGRGYLFQQQMTSSVPFKVWRSNIDIERVGVKGLSRVTLEGTPTQRENARG